MTTVRPVTSVTSMAQRSRRPWAAMAAAAAIVASACGSDSDGGSDTPPLNETVPEAGTTPTTASGEAAPFPVTVEHAFGTTTIDTEPERVVSVGFNEHDFLLALDVVPVALRDWYGDQPNGVWPWAQDELGDASPEVLSSGELSFEQIAALDPDLIVGVWSGITEDDYELLSAIAPVVAQPGEYDVFGTPWQEQTRILGRALGREELADEVVSEVEADLTAARDAHPEWEGLTASVAFVTEDGPGAYTSQDTRSRFLRDLGFEIPAINDSIDDGSFYLDLSAEDLSPLDVDALVWVVGSATELDAIIDLPTRPTLDAVREGREIFADVELSGAFSHSSPLSLEFVIETMVEELEAAVDGDPATPTPSSIAAGAAVPTDPVNEPSPPDDADQSTASADAAAAADAWSLVFDSGVPFEEKEPHLEDAASLADTIAAYAEAGAGFGGISLAPTGVVVDGTIAEITYDVMFGENAAYTDVTGTITLVDGTWTVDRAAFCSFMASARVACSP